MEAPDTPSHMPEPRARASRAVLWVLSWISALFVAALAWTLIVSLTIWKPTGYLQDPQLGRIYAPGIYIHGVEGYSWSRIGERGIREDPMPRGAAPSRTVLFLGDSFTEAFQVPVKSSFAHGVGNLLAQAGTPVAVVNAGRSGASPAFYAEAHQALTSAFHPDAVVIQMSDQDFATDLLNADGNFYLKRSGDSYASVFNPAFVSANSLVQAHPQIAPLLDEPLVRVVLDNAQKLSASSRRAAPAPVPQTDPKLVAWVASTLARDYPGAVVLYVPEMDYSGDLARRTETEVIATKALADAGLTVVDPRDALAADFRASGQPGFGFPNTMPTSGHLNVRGHAVVAAQLATALRGMLK